MIFLAFFTAKTLRRVETGEKIIKIANQCLLYLPTVKYSRDLRAHKIKRTTTVKKAMTRGNVLVCTKPKYRCIQQHKKDPGLQQQIENKIIEMFCMLMQIQLTLVLANPEGTEQFSSL